ncbi:hypothetical protein Lalb_Chr10g0100151 [Lupinus albus]|uniref:Uncharacterized protein n=1 Tax=Lupinus albus TaxID=3870 RepID=A0A6A4PWN4_LUPAL|nr:hypothetical protein Lalb_Chr10g0100151 [Lupinus albus]
MNFVIQGGHIRIRFPHVRPHARNVTPICLKFGAGVSVKYSNMTKPYVSEAESQGQHTLVISSTKAHTLRNSKGFNIF